MSKSGMRAAGVTAEPGVTDVRRKMVNSSVPFIALADGNAIPQIGLGVSAHR
jgi:hypothetical protein